MNQILYREIKPVDKLADFVDSFWMLENNTADKKEVVVIPDGRIDISFSYSMDKAYHVTLNGLESKAIQSVIDPHTIMFAVSFKLPAVEYLLDIKIPSLSNTFQILPDDFWQMDADDLNDFDSFCIKISNHLAELVKPNLDNRKINLFRLIYSSAGTRRVKELSEQVNWTSRQINRYFNNQFGISLKSYCNILRFKASFKQLKAGILFPGQNFADQAHFIKDVKKFSGVSPGQLAKNKNDRFIQLSVLPQ